ncbi:26S proteasome non-ATPase regulatory subunit 2-like [Schistocerca nitens]|uniref:26S proteasome non-ATPase regulatory subunit 2-like n=1 Tax=Schistocerca nitens TaxID=7011 RepID=UPI0021195A1E|nr:26S proteasome non-ATPase regulatory subunit 2-like [Schistocerca nitens]
MLSDYILGQLFKHSLFPLLNNPNIAHSEENKHIEEEINLMMEKLKEDDYSQYRHALETLRNLIRSATTSMTSVPFPLKHMRSHYPALKEIHRKMKEGKTRSLCADVISVVSMAMSDVKELEGKRECLKYCLQGLQRDIADWGHEYVRQLETEIAEEWLETPLYNNDSTREQLLELVKAIVEFDTKHNAEIQACDLLMEIGCLDVLEPYVDAANHSRICRYLASCALYVDEAERSAILNTVMNTYMKFQEHGRALCLALQIGDMEKVCAIFNACTDLSMRKQLAFIAARQLVFVDSVDDESVGAQELISVMSNTHLSDHFHKLARELDILEPKTPEDVYKTWLENTSLTFPTLDSARNNLASSIVNAFVNAGFCSDKLMTADNGKHWIYRNKDRGMLSATASLGLIYLWDVEGGLSPIDRYLYTSEDFIKSGALLALGVVNCGVRNECEPAKALLMDYVLHVSNILRIGSVLGLGLAYAGSNRDDILELLLVALADENSSPEVVGLAAAACGLIAVGTCNDTVVSAIVHRLLHMSTILKASTYARFLPLGLGLCFLAQKEAVQTCVAVLDDVSDPLKQVAQTMLQICAYAGTANVLVIQQMLHICSEHHEPQEEPESVSTDKKQTKIHQSKSVRSQPEVPFSEDVTSVQSVAALGVAVIAIGEEIGNEMTIRMFGHLSRYGELAVRRAVPLAIALSSISNPQLALIEMLNKFSHDSDPEVAQNAIFSMGLVGAGSNNARLATMLRHLAQFHGKNPEMLFMVRIAQGLTHMGKGTMSLAPFHTDRQVLSRVALGGLLIVLTGCLDIRNIILGKSHYLLYCLVAAMHPRWLITLDENLEPVNVFVRVGQALDVVGKAGTPKSITRGQTHTTPVLLGVGERAELTSEEYIPLSPVMEGFVILRKNPDFEFTN